MSEKFEKEELYNLDLTIAKFILPRLVEYRKTVKRLGAYPGYVGSSKKWCKILSKIIRAFELCVKCEREVLTEDEIVKYKKGLKLFAKYFDSLWY